jgi:hypothetical protein
LRQPTPSLLFHEIVISFEARGRFDGGIVLNV